MNDGQIRQPFCLLYPNCSLVSHIRAISAFLKNRGRTCETNYCSLIGLHALIQLGFTDGVLHVDKTPSEIGVEGLESCLHTKVITQTFTPS